MRNIAILGHRGCSGLAPENTRSAIVLAKEHHATGVELDVSLLGDGTPVIFHNQTVDQCTNGHGALKNFTLETFSDLDAGSWFAPQFIGEQCLTLHDALQLLAEMNMDLNLELKFFNDTHRESLVKNVVDVIRQYNFLTNKLLVSSFDVKILRLFRKLMPLTDLAILYDKKLPIDWQKTAKLLSASTIVLNMMSVNDKIINSVQQIDLKVYVSTVNDRSSIYKSINMGVDGIITDFPDRCYQIIQHG